MSSRKPRRGAVLLLVLAAMLLLATTVTLLARRIILIHRSIDAAAAAAQAESVWVTAAEAYRRSDSASELQFSLPDQGSQSRTAVARVHAREEDQWEIEVVIEQNGRPVARRRGTVAIPQSARPTSTASASPEGEGDSQ